jgi:hypothetical protein
MGDLGVREVIENALAALTTEGPAPHWIVHQSPQTTRQLLLIPFMENQGGITDYVGYFTGVRPDNTGLTRHGFNQNPAKLLLPVAARARRQRKDVKAFMYSTTSSEWTQGNQETLSCSCSRRIMLSISTR